MLVSMGNKYYLISPLTFKSHQKAINYLIWLITPIKMTF